MPRKPKNVIRLNDRVIESLKCQERTEYWDELAQGLKLVVYQNGSKAWTCRPQVSAGRQRRVTLGHWCQRGGLRDKDCITTTEARDRFLLLMAEARRGALAEPKIQPTTDLGDTFAAVASRYFEHHQRLIERRSPGRKRARTMAEERRVIETDVLPATCEGRLVAELSVREIRPVHLVAILRRISSRGSMVMRERARAYVSNIMRYAMMEGIIEMNPVTAVPRMTREEPRARRFSEAEVATLWRLWTGVDSRAVSSRQAPETPYFFCLGLLTLARRDELRHMEWKRIKESSRGWVWTIPVDLKMPDGSRLELVKNGIEHHVPLSNLAIKILMDKVRPVTGGNRWVWPSSVKEKWPRSPTAVQKAKNRYQKAAELEDFRTHDLRSIAATILAQLKVPEEIISSACNHKPRSITSRVYIRQQERFFEERAEALEKLARFVQQLATGADGGRILAFPN